MALPLPMLVVASLVSLLTVTEGTENLLPVVCVNRRNSGDLWYTSQTCTWSNSSACPCMRSDGSDCRPTYVVSERACTSNEELVGRCHFQIVPEGVATSKSLSEPPSNMGVTIEDDVLMMDTSNDIERSSSPAAVVFHSNHTQSLRLLNSSYCNISSLEVYRGREQVFHISHNGFTLTDAGYIQVEEAMLAYNRVDYDGELFRLNVSCLPEMDSMINNSGNLEFPQTGCLLFKLITSSIARIGQAKFNCTLPGTLEAGNNCTMSSSSTTTNSTDTTTLTTEIPGGNGGLDRFTLYLIIGAGGSVGALIIILMCLCVLIGCLATRKNKRYVFSTSSATTNGPRQLESIPPPLPPQRTQGHITGVQVNPVNHASNYHLENPAYGDRDTQPTNTEEHTYAVVMGPEGGAEDTQQLIEQPSGSAAQPQQGDSIDQVTVETFKPGKNTLTSIPAFVAEKLTPKPVAIPTVPSLTLESSQPHVSEKPSNTPSLGPESSPQKAADIAKSLSMKPPLLSERSPQKPPIVPQIPFLKPAIQFTDSSPSRPSVPAATETVSRKQHPTESNDIRFYEEVTSPQAKVPDTEREPADQEEYDKLMHDGMHKPRHYTVPSSKNYSRLFLPDRPRPPPAALPETIEMKKTKRNVSHTNGGQNLTPGLSGGGQTHHQAQSRHIPSGYSKIEAPLRDSQPSPPPLPPPFAPTEDERKELQLDTHRPRSPPDMIINMHKNPARIDSIYEPEEDDFVQWQSWRKMNHLVESEAIYDEPPQSLSRHSSVGSYIDMMPGYSITPGPVVKSEYSYTGNSKQFSQNKHVL